MLTANYVESFTLFSKINVVLTKAHSKANRIIRDNLRIAAMTSSVAVQQARVKALCLMSEKACQEFDKSNLEGLKEIMAELSKEEA